MREILFRAKTVKNVHWIWGDMFRAGTEPSDGEFAISYWDDEDGWMNENVQPATIGQFTGLTDKNGKRIFEGDIVECVSWNEYFSKDGKPMEPFRRKMFVDYRKGGFKMVEPMPEPMKDNEWDIICNGDIVVIGNIHDDPQLIDMKRLGEIMSDPRLWEMPEEAKQRGRQRIMEIAKREMKSGKMHVYLFHDNDDGEQITNLWTTSVPDIGEQIILWDEGEHHHYEVTRRIYGANAEEKVGVWNLYVKPKRKGFID